MMTKRLLLHDCVLYLILSTAFVWPVSAQPNKLKGYIKGLGNRPVVFAYQQNGVNKSDTVWAKQDQFVYAPQPSDDGLISLRINRPRYTSFWYEPGVITVRGEIDKPYKLIITGSLENGILTKYNQTIDWAFEDKKKGQSDSVATLLTEQQQQAIIGFIRQHPNARTSAYLLYWETLIRNSQPTDLYRHLLQGLSPTVQASLQGKQVRQRITILENQPVVGRKAPIFALPDTSGQLVSLASFSGKYVLLDFWGHWCSPCLKAFPKLKALSEQYKDKIVLIGVAAEFASDKGQWIRTINSNHLPWIQVSELKADKGDVNTQYNITAFPTYLLLNKQGVVVARALDLEIIQKKLISLSDL